MTPEMLDLARRNAAKADGGKPIANVEFHQATIDKLPLPDASVDCVISNCVINLAPDKPAVFREIVRVLKPGGRLAVSDIALKKPLPPEIGDDLMAYVGCIAGAILIEEYREQLLEAGFAHVEIIDTGSRPERLRQSRESIGLLFAGDGILAAAGFGKLLLVPAVQRRRPASALGRPAAALQRERLCRQRPRLRREADLRSGRTPAKSPSLLECGDLSPLFEVVGPSARRCVPSPQEPPVTANPFALPPSM